MSAREPGIGALLLGDARFPAGGHAHSGGVEPAVTAGTVTDLRTLEAFLRGRLRTAGLVAAAIAAAACAHARLGPQSTKEPELHGAGWAPGVPERAGGEASPADKGGPGPVGGVARDAGRGTASELGNSAEGEAAAPVLDDYWATLDAEADARTPAPAQREASRRQGRALLRAARVAWPDAAGLADLAAAASRRGPRTGGGGTAGRDGAANGAATADTRGPRTGGGDMAGGGGAADGAATADTRGARAGGPAGVLAGGDGGSGTGGSPSRVSAAGESGGRGRPAGPGAAPRVEPGSASRYTAPLGVADSEARGARAVLGVADSEARSARAGGPASGDGAAGRRAEYRGGPHHAVVLGAAAAAAGCGPLEAARVAAYQAVAGPASAAVRLLALDPMRVTGLLARLAGDIDQVAADAAGYAGGPPGELPAASGPALDLLAEAHIRAEARLFES